MKASALRRSIQRFLRNEDGVISIEAALCWPLLCAGCAITMIMWSGFEARVLSLRANYTISDLLSRGGETSSAEIDQLNTVFGMASGSRLPTAIRVSAIGAVEDADGNLDYELRWSQASGGIDYADQLVDIMDEGGIPQLVDGESVIVVDTFRRWIPMRFFFSNFGPQILAERVVTRPRFVTRLECADCPSP